MQPFLERLTLTCLQQHCTRDIDSCICDHKMIRKTPSSWYNNMNTCYDYVKITKWPSCDHKEITFLGDLSRPYHEYSCSLWTCFYEKTDSRNIHAAPRWAKRFTAELHIQNKEVQKTPAKYISSEWMNISGGKTKLKHHVLDTML